MNFIFIFLCWMVGIVGNGHDDGFADRIRARAKCRDIRVRKTEVVVKFTCEEDAKLFAEDLQNFTRE